MTHTPCSFILKERYDKNYTTQIQKSQLDALILGPECLY